MGKAYLMGGIVGINDSPYYAMYGDANTQLYALVPKEKITIPTIDEYNTAASTTFAPPSATSDVNVAYSLLYIARRIIVPAYFTNFNCNFGNISAQAWTNLEAIEWYGSGTNQQLSDSASATVLYYNNTLKEIVAPNYTGRLLMAPLRRSSFKYVVPQASYIIQSQQPTDTSSYWELTDDSDFSEVPIVGNNTSSFTNTGPHPLGSMAGNIHLDACTTFYGSPVPMSGIQSKPLNIYLPEIENFYNAYTTFSADDTANGYANIYLGSNLSSIAANLSTYAFIGNINRGHLTVHIPAGNSTTKTTLDTLGISYIQDYDPET